MSHYENSSCSLRYTGGRLNKDGEEYVIYASCRYEKKEQRFRFEVYRLKENSAIELIRSTISVQYQHDNVTKIRNFTPLRGTERKIWTNKLDDMGFQKFMTKLINEIGTEKLQDEDNQFLRRINTIHKLQSNENCNARLTLESKDF